VRIRRGSTVAEDSDDEYNGYEARDKEIRLKECRRSAFSECLANRNPSAKLDHES